MFKEGGADRECSGATRWRGLQLAWCTLGDPQTLLTQTIFKNYKLAFDARLWGDKRV
jgi:hypothetical protein